MRKEINKEWEDLALKEHRKNLLACILIMSIGFMLVMCAPQLLVAKHNHSVFTFMLAATFGFFLFIGLIKLIEIIGAIERKDRKEWEQLEKRLKFKSKVQ